MALISFQNQLVSENVLDLNKLEEGFETTDEIEEISDFKRTGTDGLSFEKVGHKGDLEVYYNGEHQQVIGRTLLRSLRMIFLDKLDSMSDSNF